MKKTENLKNKKADLSMEMIIGMIIAFVALLVILKVYGMIRGAVEVL